MINFELKLVLENDGESLFVVSKYVLDSQCYSTGWDPVERKTIPTTWEVCNLRAWLNSNFYNIAFNAGEQMWIETTLVDNSMPEDWSWKTVTGGNDTYDKVFVLSYSEVMKYFPMTERYYYPANTWAEGGFADYNSNFRVKPTAYAIAQGADWHSEKDAENTTEVLTYMRYDAIRYASHVALRTPSSEQTWIEVGTEFGWLGTGVVTRTDMSTRPAMRISIK